MRPVRFFFSLRVPDTTGAADLSCRVSDGLWDALGALPEHLLFHPRLLAALDDLAAGVTEGDLTNAVIDLVVNGAEV